MTPRESTAAEDAELLSAVGNQDERAFAALYERFSTPLYSLLMKMLQNQEDAEEVLQSVFLQIWRKAATYDPERCAVFTWMVLIARSKGIDRIRQRSRQVRTTEALSREEHRTETADGADAEAVLNDNASAIASALKTIPAEQRQAIEMAFFRGMSQSEISEALAEPLGTVKARIRRGMVRLRDYLVRRL